LGAHVPPKADFGEIRVMDVATESEDSRRGAPAPAGCHLDQEPLDPAEGVVERGPVLEVERPTKLLGPAGRPASPGTAADRLVPGLEVVKRRNEQERQRVDEEEMVDVARRLAGEPLVFGV